MIKDIGEAVIGTYDNARYLACNFSYLGGNRVADWSPREGIIKLAQEDGYENGRLIFVSGDAVTLDREEILALLHHFEIDVNDGVSKDEILDYISTIQDLLKEGSDE